MNTPKVKWLKSVQHTTDYQFSYWCVAGKWRSGGKQYGVIIAVSDIWPYGSNPREIDRGLEAEAKKAIRERVRQLSNK